MDESKSEPREYPECHEGPAATKAFQQMLKKVLTTSPAEIEKRDKEWRERRDKK